MNIIENICCIFFLQQYKSYFLNFVISVSGLIDYSWTDGELNVSLMSRGSLFKHVAQLYQAYRSFISPICVSLIGILCSLWTVC